MGVFGFRENNKVIVYNLSRWINLILFFFLKRISSEPDFHHFYGREKRQFLIKFSIIISKISLLSELLVRRYFRSNTIYQYELMTRFRKDFYFIIWTFAIILIWMIINCDKIVLLNRLLLNEHVSLIRTVVISFFYRPYVYLGCFVI